jgi:hypothetical protein
LLPRIVARIVQAHNAQHTALVHEQLIARSDHRVPLVERMVQRPRHIVGQALRPHLIVDSMLATPRGITFEILAHLSSAIMDFVCRLLMYSGRSLTS